MGDGFYRSKDPTNSTKVLKEKAVKENKNNTKNIRHIEIRNSTVYTLKRYEYITQQVP